MLFKVKVMTSRPRSRNSWQCRRSRQANTYIVLHLYIRLIHSTPIQHHSTHSQTPLNSKSVKRHNIMKQLTFARSFLLISCSSLNVVEEVEGVPAKPKDLYAALFCEFGLTRRQIRIADTPSLYPSIVLRRSIVISRDRSVKRKESPWFRSLMNMIVRLHGEMRWRTKWSPLLRFRAFRG